MKKLLLLCLWGIQGLAIGQAAQGLDRSLKLLRPNYSPQSPNVASLAKFGNYPVTMFTGLPSISIPIYNIKVGAISVPISLSYHASGIKVTEAASWVGLGWNLNVGGNVSRSVTGLPDELTGAYFDSGIPTNLGNAPADAAQCYARKELIQRYMDNLQDMGADVFSISLPSVSNKFVYQRQISTNNTVSLTPTTIPYDKVKIEYVRDQSSLLSFKITDENGVKYTCNSTELTSNGLFPSGPGSTFTGAWHLNKIEGHNASEVVQFTYHPVQNYSDFSDWKESQVVTDKNSIAGTNVEGINSNSYTSTFNFIAPKEILFPGGKVTFELQSTDRQDLFDMNFYGNPPLKALQSITVWGLNIQTLAYEKVKVYEMQTSYFGTNTEEKRLRLDGVLVKDKNNVIIEKYGLGYNSTLLPKRKSKDRDMFGYYNGPKNNTTLIPAMSVQTQTFLNSTIINYNIGGADRSISEQYSQACVLNKINYPTGGFTEFSYENNRYTKGTLVNALAGGLRIKKMRSCPTADCSNGITKVYKYGENENNTGTLNNFMVYTPNAQLETNNFLNTSLLRSVQEITATIALAPSGSGGSGEVEAYSRRRIYMPNYSFNVNGFDGSPVVYTTVTEYDETRPDFDPQNPLPSALASSNGKTVFKFRAGTPDVIKSYSNQQFSNKTTVESYHWERGQLEEKTVYDKVGNIVQQTKNMYEVKKYDNLLNCGFNVAYVHDYSGQTPMPNDCIVHSVDEYFIEYYGFRVGNTKLVQSTETMNGVTKISTTDYDPNYYMPIKSTTTNSKKGFNVSETKYPFHYASQVTGPQTGLGRGVQLLLEKNMLGTPIEELTYIMKNASDASPTVTGSTLHFYTEPSNNLGYVFPKSAYIYSGMNAYNPLPSLVRLSFSNSLPSMDSKYEKRIEFENYDNVGNLLSYNTDGQRSGYEWTKTTFDNLTLSVLKSETANLGGTPSLTKNYTYTIPLIGLKTSQQPNGLTNSFEYDAIGRLVAIRDPNNNLVKSYSYNYRNQ